MENVSEQVMIHKFRGEICPACLWDLLLKGMITEEFIRLYKHAHTTNGR
jgi:hypothetical protein